MKRFVLLLGIIMLFAGLKLRDRGVLRVTDEGVFYTQVESQLKNVDIPIFNNSDVYQRFDVQGVSVQEAILKMRARIIYTQDLQDMKIYYCYSPLIKKSVTLKGKTINLMIADRSQDLVIGSPLIKGSY